MTQQKIKRVALLLFVLLSGTASAYVYHFRPLIQTKSYIATVSLENIGQVPAKVYTMLWRPNRLFVELPQSHRKRWFTCQMNTQSITVPNQIKQTPYLHFNHDMSGVGLDSDKIEDNWQID